MTRRRAKIPTCHRSSFDSVMEDDNFDQACENADAVARKVYRDEAKQIEELRKRDYRGLRQRGALRHLYLLQRKPTKTEAARLTAFWHGISITR